MKHMKHLLALALACCMTLTCVTYAEVDRSVYAPRYDEPITLSYHLTTGSANVYSEGYSVEDNYYTRWIKDKFNIDIELAWVAADGTTNQQKLDLAFASDDLPDLIYCSANQLARYVDAGKIVPMDELIEKYASPLVKWALQDAETTTGGKVFQPATINGVAYAFPVINDSLSYKTAQFIRQDYLDAMNMEMPKTLEELESVFAAYLEFNPDGYALGLDKTLDALQVAMAPYKAYREMWVEKEDGTIAYGSIQPEMKRALAKMHEWYEAGYIDPEFVVKDGSEQNAQLSAGDLLLYYGPWSSIGGALVNLWKADENAETSIMPWIQGEDGTTGLMKNTWFTNYCAITTNCEHPEAWIYLFNDAMDSYYRNEPYMHEIAEQIGYTFMYPETEVLQPKNVEEVAKKYPDVTQPQNLWSYDYDPEVEGFSFFREDNALSPSSMLIGIRGQFLCMGNMNYTNLAYAAETGDTSKLTSVTLRQYNQWMNTHPKMLTTFSKEWDYLNAFEQTEEFRVNAYAGPNTPTMTEKMAYLDKLEEETFVKIIMGTEPVDSFDEFVENWMVNGGQEITEEVNAWYQSVQ